MVKGFEGFDYIGRFHAEREVRPNVLPSDDAIFSDDERARNGQAPRAVGVVRGDIHAKGPRVEFLDLG